MHTAKFFQLNAALLLIDHMHGESEEPRGIDECPICRDAVAEWDAGCQLEPCRRSDGIGAGGIMASGR